MVWKLHRSETTVKELVLALNRRIGTLLVRGKKIDEEMEAHAAVAEKLKMFAGELGIAIAIGFCKLPGCGHPFVKIPPTKEFCLPEHKTIYNNKYCR